MMHWHSLNWVLLSWMTSFPLITSELDVWKPWKKNMGSRNSNHSQISAPVHIDLGYKSSFFLMNIQSGGFAIIVLYARLMNTFKWHLVTATTTTTTTTVVMNGGKAQKIPRRRHLSLSCFKKPNRNTFQKWKATRWCIHGQKIVSE